MNFLILYWQVMRKHNEVYPNLILQGNLQLEFIQYRVDNAIKWTRRTADEDSSRSLWWKLENLYLTTYSTKLLKIKTHWLVFIAYLLHCRNRQYPFAIWQYVLKTYTISPAFHLCAVVWARLISRKEQYYDLKHVARGHIEQIDSPFYAADLNRSTSDGWNKVVSPEHTLNI
jgi:hypothetical protein